jgi:hypothetical protein
MNKNFSRREFGLTKITISRDVIGTNIWVNLLLPFPGQNNDYQGNMFVQNIGMYLQTHMMSHPVRP